jgi:PAS domain S-box-containing protein
MSQGASPAAVGLRPPAGLALRTVLDLSRQVLCACDLAGRLRWCNAGFERVVGRGGGEVLGVGLGELTDEEGRAALAEAGVPLGDEPDGARSAPAEEAAPAGAECSALAAMRRPDGSWRLVDWRVRVDRRRGLVFAAGRDVTERRAADEAARAAEARLRAILDHSPSPIFVKDLGGRYLIANDAWSRLWGRTPEQMTGRSDLELDPRNAARLADMEAGLATGTSVRGDLHLEAPDGGHDLLVSLFTLAKEDGTRLATCGIGADITERRQVEVRLVERQRLLDAVLEASPDIVSLLDENGRVTTISSAEQAMLGHRHLDPTDSELYSLVHPDDFDYVASAFIAMVTGSRAQLHVRYRVRHADGRWITVDSRARALTDDRGRFRGAVVVTRDVSARLASELRLKELRRAAEQASRAKSDFLSRMSHELRTPLNAILGFSQLLQMDELAVEQAEAVDHILRGGRHLLQLIDEVLDIARIETGHLDLALGPVPVADAVREAVTAVRPLADRAEVVVQVAAGTEGSPAVLADPRRLVQVLSNVVSNGVKYNRPGGRVDIWWELTPGGRVRVAVADTGHGIRPEDIAGVFEPFNRLGAAHSGVEGTGVGLTLARHLVERMHGTLEVESVPEVGSTFFVELARAELLDLPGSGSRTGGADPGAPAFRVLLVEEDLHSLELVERVTSRRPGVVVLAARDAPTALDIARQQKPDLVLLDLELRGSGAPDLLERLGAEPATASIPVAVLAGEAAGGQVRRLLGRGVAGQLAKPVDARALLSLLDAARAASGR